MPMRLKARDERRPDRRLRLFLTESREKRLATKRERDIAVLQRCREFGSRTTAAPPCANHTLEQCGRSLPVNIKNIKTAMLESKKRGRVSGSMFAMRKVSTATRDC